MLAMGSLFGMWWPYLFTDVLSTCTGLLVEWLGVWLYIWNIYVHTFPRIFISSIWYICHLCPI